MIIGRRSTKNSSKFSKSFLFRFLTNEPLYYLKRQDKRPIGVTIIAILAIIGGVILTFGGISLLTFGAFFTSVPLDVFISEQMQEQQKQQQQQQELLQQQQQRQQQQELKDAAELQELARFLGGVGIAIGAVVLAVGIGYLVVSYGLLKGKGWAWIITIILTIIAIAVQIISGVTASMFNASFIDETNSFVTGIIAQIIGIAINGIILYYLYRPNVKAFFGRSLTSTGIKS
jgi:anaerobic C4-dicarboxylate transporter